MSPAAVVNVGARTPVGLNARQTGFLLRAGFPAMAESPLADAEGCAVSMGFVPTIDSRLVGPGRLCELARPALGEAAGVLLDARVEVYIGLDEGYPDTVEAKARLEAMARGVLPQAIVHVETKGEVAAGGFLTTALRRLEARTVDAAVIGGVHSDYDPRVIASLDASGRLLSPENLDARIPGEAAAFVVVMRESDAARRGLVPLARIIGTGTGTERARPHNDHPASEALGLTEAVEQATAPLRKSALTAGWMLTDLTSEMRRLYEWQSVFVRAQKLLGKPYVIESPAQRIGYLGAAAMPLFVVMAATAWKYGYAPSETALAIAGNDEGERLAMVLVSGRTAAELEQGRPEGV